MVLFEEKVLREQRRKRKKLLSVQNESPKDRNSKKSPGGKRAYQKSKLAYNLTPETIVHDSTIDLLGDVMHEGIQDVINNPKREAAALQIQQLGRQSLLDLLQRSHTRALDRTVRSDRRAECNHGIQSADDPLWWYLAAQG